jgi:hypothetical protein
VADTFGIVQGIAILYGRKVEIRGTKFSNSTDSPRVYAAMDLRAAIHWAVNLV